MRLLADLGSACAKYHDERVRGLTCKRIQCDEIWSFVYSKAKNVPAKKQGHYGYGDCWTWVAICVADHVWELEELVALLDQAS